jgi:hypothetical protein
MKGNQGGIMQTRIGLSSGLIYLFTVLVGVLVAACASVDGEAVRSSVTKAESAVNQAVANDAREYAPLELKMAQEKLSRAQMAMAADDLEEAGYLAEEAMADAQLAEVKADSAKTEEMVQTLTDSIEDLRQEIEQRSSVQ